MSWCEPRSYSFNIRDPRFAEARRFFAIGTDDGAEKGRALLRELCAENPRVTLKKGRHHVKPRRKAVARG